VRGLYRRRANRKAAASAHGVPVTLLRCRGYIGESYQQAPHEAPGHEFCP
jgi:hypothetical protein